MGTDSAPTYVSENKLAGENLHLLDGVSILVVDDAPDVLEMVAFLLAKYGATVQTARDGAEAMNKARQEKFDCILMDLRMPGIDGNQTARNIRDEKPETVETTAFIALTGEQHKETLDGGSFPFDSWIFKPVKPHVLSQLIHDNLKHCTF